MRRCGKPGEVNFISSSEEVVYFGALKVKKEKRGKKKAASRFIPAGWNISINQSCVVEHLHVHSIWYRHLHKSLHWSGASVCVDLHGSSIQHLALSLRALFQDEDGFLSV